MTTSDDNPGSNESASSSANPASSLLHDTPIADPEQDALGRAPFARQLATAIRQMPAEDGFTFALNGPWGSGKTSVLNFVLSYIEQENSGDNRVVVVRFNPWWFSGREQILLQFFRQLRSSLAGKDVPAALKRVGDAIGRFSELIEPFGFVLTAVGVPSQLQAAAKALGGRLKRTEKPPDLNQTRTSIDNMLRMQSARILVVIDDIDRLTGEEIRELFLLVKSVADFPNTIYLLAFDHEVVVKVLNSVQGGTGERYLEKIVQGSFELPLPDRTDLQFMLFRHLDELIQMTPGALWDQDEWSNVFVEGIDSFIQTPRDIKRFINALRPAYTLVAEDVSCVDFIALQAIRVFVPPLYSFIAANKARLTGADDEGRTGEASRQEARELFDAILAELPGERREPSQHLMTTLFPRWASAHGGGVYGHGWLDEWHRQRRICSPDVFDIYFRLSVSSEDISLSEMKAIIDISKQPGAFARELVRLAGMKRRDSTTRLRLFLERLQFYTETEIPKENVEPILEAFFEVGDQFYIETDRHGMFDFGNDMRVMRIAQQLLKDRFTQDERFELLSRVLSKAKAILLLAEKVAVLGQEHGKLGASEPREPEQNRTVNLQQLDELERIATGRIRWAVEAGTLRNTPALGSVLFRFADWASQEEARAFATSLIQTDEGLVDFLRGFETWEYRSGNRGSDKLTWLVPLSNVQKFLDMDVSELLSRCDDILAASPDWLTPLKRRALQAFVDGIRNPEDRSPFGR